MASEPEKTDQIVVTELPALGEEHERFSITKIPTDEALKQAFAAVDNSLKYIDKVRELVLIRTKPNDWTNQSGNPYLGEAGLQRFRAVFQIFERDVVGYTIDAQGRRRKFTEEKAFDGDIKFIIYEGTMGSTLLGVEATIEGGSALEDKFRTKDDVLFYSKKAKANWVGRGLRKLLGLDNLTWDDLAKVNITKENVKAVERSTTDRPESDDMKKLWQYLLDLNEGNTTKAEDYLEKLTTSEQYKGKRRPSRLTDGQMKWIFPKVKTEHKTKFPEKHVDEKNGTPATSSKFLDSVKLFADKLGEAEFKSFLYEKGLDDVSKVPQSEQNKLLVELKKRVEERTK